VVGVKKNEKVATDDEKKKELAKKLVIELCAKGERPSYKNIQERFREKYNEYISKGHINNVLEELNKEGVVKKQEREWVCGDSIGGAEDVTTDGLLDGDAFFEEVFPSLSRWEGDAGVEGELKKVVESVKGFESLKDSFALKRPSEFSRDLFRVPLIMPINISKFKEAKGRIKKTKKRLDENNLEFLVFYYSTNEDSIKLMATESLARDTEAPPETFSHLEEPCQFGYIYASISDVEIKFQADYLVNKFYPLFVKKVREVRKEREKNGVFSFFKKSPKRIPRLPNVEVALTIACCMALGSGQPLWDRIRLYWNELGLWKKYEQFISSVINGLKG